MREVTPATGVVVVSEELCLRQGAGWRLVITKSSPFKYFRTSPWIIRLAVMLMSDFLCR